MFGLVVDCETQALFNDALMWVMSKAWFTEPRVSIRISFGKYTCGFHDRYYIAYSSKILETLFLLL